VAAEDSAEASEEDEAQLQRRLPATHAPAQSPRPREVPDAAAEEVDAAELLA